MMKTSIILILAFALISLVKAEDWVHFMPHKSKANGNKIVFITGDDEYKSESSMPMMAHILAERHGFDCKVLFAINRKTRVIDTNQRDNIPGLEALEDADLVVMYTRFRSLVDEQMQMIDQYLTSGRPIIGIRTSTHAFDFKKESSSSYKNYSYSHESGGFGKKILGQNWIRHWGNHGKQASRGRFPPEKSNHPILRGIKDGQIWGPTDVYEADMPQPIGCETILLGEVCENMEPDGGPLAPPPEDATGRQAIDKNDPMMPIAWTYHRDVGEKGRVFVSTIGGAMSGDDDWANAGMRRMFVNACYWALHMEDNIPSHANVSPLLQPNPFRRGVKPKEALEQGLADLAAKESTILFYGNSMVERLLEHGEMEARLQIARPNHNLKIRSLAWTGDEVGNRLRPEGYSKHLKNLLNSWPAGTIVLGYGLNEAFGGEEGLPEFKNHYQTHLKQLHQLHPNARFVLLTPISVSAVDVTPYSKVIKGIAEEHGAECIDLTAITKDLKNKGIHLSDSGNSLIAKKISQILIKDSVPEPKKKHLQKVIRSVSVKHHRVAELVRPKNAVVYYGVRARPHEYNAEMPRYYKMIDMTEEIVHRLASDGSLTFDELPNPEISEMTDNKGRDDGKRTGIIKSVAQNQAEFTVAKGYAVNLFASEEEFPELRNPVQIAFDARGRLWAVTMPSFPHTVPGRPQLDKILIFEDTNRDGKADKMTIFAEGLDALDGIAFHRDGVIISEQPRLWLMNDTNGDDRADTRKELLRGIDVTDSHHGGMIATDPSGDIIFSDGVFHRSQLETPVGVHRGIDATTYRFDPASGLINTEWQHTTPNPWNVTFDRWGNIFQMYGDGDVYDGTSLIWTPLGAYMPYAYGRITSYGKGCGTASISSSNFPDEYQQGLASASLLGRYAVNLTKLKVDDGMIKQLKYETILSSPNAAFRPADLEFGMDGALYVSDFCSPIIGHAQHPMRDPNWDHDFGRIWRIVHTEKPIVQDWPKIEDAESKNLCKLLLHPQDLVRHHSRIELRKLGTKSFSIIDQWLQTLDQESSDFDQAALEAIFVCDGNGQGRPELIKHLLKSESPMYRGAGVRMLRLQANQIPNTPEILATMVKDSHPRVQIEVIDAIAHLRPKFTGIDKCLSNLTPINSHVKNSLAYLELGIEPVKGRSVPVLDVSSLAQLRQWLWLGEDGDNVPVEYEVGKGRLPGVGLFRTFLYSEISQPAILGINSKRLEVRHNGVLKFRQDSLWSGDQQVQLELSPGLNIIEVHLLKGRRSSHSMPSVHLYDPVGQALSQANYLTDITSLRAATIEYDELIAKQGKVLRIQATSGLQFAPNELRATPGSKIKLIFNNPDIMSHNWVLLTPGSTEDFGALADALASSPEGVKQNYLPKSKRIIVSSKMLAPNESQELVFDTPDEPGEYPFICTFPGHWRIMQGTLVVANLEPVTKSKPSPKESSKVISNKNVTIESSNSPEAFKKLIPKGMTDAKISSNLTTSNDPINILIDGKLTEAYGPVFPNGIKTGAYKVDLGSIKPISAVTSWSFNAGSRRGEQKLTIYGSNSKTDPGWETRSLTKLGTIHTGQPTAKYTGASLRESNGQTLGSYRWVIWKVSPISEIGMGENSAFQELHVEISDKAIIKKNANLDIKPKNTESKNNPNIILVMTDDQGWGEVGFHGNNHLKTPNLDRFAAEGTELTNFYVSPMCTPTRSSLMTGRYHFRTGAHDTYIGRSNMNPQEVTMAEIFAKAGYSTGIFGKWHLGENYPMRAIDQGFQKAVVHGGGGIGQFADYPQNSYWDPTLMFNDHFQKAKGYCTDIFIDESIKFISKNRSKPFFCYIPLNIPHSPFQVDKKFTEFYASKIEENGRQWTTPIYGMISQFDYAFQRLLDSVKKMKLRENTIIIFMTDNGPNSTFFTAGLRARKGSVYENGFRVPFVIQWPAGLKGGRKVDNPSMHIDLLPTLADACGIKIPKELEIDGHNILPLIKGKTNGHKERYLFMQHNRANIPPKYKNCMVRKGPWKVVGNSGTPQGFELYNVEKDPGESKNLAPKYPDKVKDFIIQYDKWFDDVTKDLGRNGGMPHPIELNPTQKIDFRFTWQDWWGEKTGWSYKNYGRWRVNNPGLIESVDISILIPQQHYGKKAAVKFMWKGTTIEKSFDALDSAIVFENARLLKGKDFMEVQLVIEGKIWGAQEVRIKPHSTKSFFPLEKKSSNKIKREVLQQTLAAQTVRSVEIPNVSGQFIRIELPGESRTLSLTEVRAYDQGVNHAAGKKATQSTTAYEGKAERAVDGNIDGMFHNGSVTHTNSSASDAWWEVDLGEIMNLEEVIIYNRRDGNAQRLNGFTIKILNSTRDIVFSKNKVPQATVVSFLRKGTKTSHVVKDQKPLRANIKHEVKPAHLFILSGQSNMVGLKPDTSFTPVVKNMLGSDSVIVVKDAQNSLGISHWVKGWKSVQGVTPKLTGNLYNRMLKNVRSAVGGRQLETVTLVWMQGERDASSNQVDVYETSLQALLEQLKHDFKRDDIRLVLGRLSDYSLDSGKHPEWSKMRDVQVAFAKSSALIDWVDTDDLNNKIHPKTGEVVNDVHYTQEGYKILGQRFADKALGLLPKAKFKGIKSDFRNFERYDRIKTKSGHFSVICPKKPAPGKPWLWRSLFWEAIRKVSDADLKLVEEGYHVVLAHGDVAGHPKGNANISAAYEYLTKNHDFAKTCSMSSMSRGTLSLFRWASANPKKVNSIYVDNGVCNVLSWPAGKLVQGNKSIASGAPESWEGFKKRFGYKTDSEALKSKESPIDLLEPLAKAGVPILMVCGNNDHAVPYEENDAIMEKRYKVLGGEIQVIVENKGHSHGMNDPSPVLNFIRKHSKKANNEKQNSNKKAFLINKKPPIILSKPTYSIESQEDWQNGTAMQTNIKFENGFASPLSKDSHISSVLLLSEKKRSAKSFTITQSPVWHNWEPIENIGPSNLGDAPVMLSLGPNNYWMFGRYGSPPKIKDFIPKTIQMKGYSLPVQTTTLPNQYKADGGVKKGRGGYHAWQSRDMINWVHHGSVTEGFSSWVTTAEYANGKLYIYYDYPNDQDPHLYIDGNLTDGTPGKNMGLAFPDPSNGSDCAFIRDLDGNFHVIYEDWSPIDASKHSWDSPLAGHAVSRNGITDFKILSPAVDERTKATGNFAEYPHPHWHATDPKKFPAKIAPKDIPQHRIKAGQKRAFGKYEVHEPKQNAYGDWAAICVGGQYYLFGDYHPIDNKIKVGWFTSPSLSEKFEFCGEIGKGHPDPDIMFAEGRFYLATQMKVDYVSPGPWVETVQARIGVDTNKDGEIDQWTNWEEIKEKYDYIPGFSKQVSKTSAKIDLSELPEGYGFKFEIRIHDSTTNPSIPILDNVTFTFQNN